MDHCSALMACPQAKVCCFVLRFGRLCAWTGITIFPEFGGRLSSWQLTQVGESSAVCELFRASRCFGSKEAAGQIELLVCVSKNEDPQQGLNFAPN